MRLHVLSAITLAVSVLAAMPALAAGDMTTVHVKLMDTSSQGWNAPPDGKGMMMQVDTATVHAGKVRFAVTNTSAVLPHEMVVLQIPSANAKLPYNPNKARVIESKVHSPGEVDDLAPGKSGDLTVTLKPGHYRLICNVAGHYMSGMSAPLTVTP